MPCGSRVVAALTFLGEGVLFGVLIAGCTKSAPILLSRIAAVSSSSNACHSVANR